MNSMQTADQSLASMQAKSDSQCRQCAGMIDAVVGGKLAKAGGSPGAAMLRGVRSGKSAKAAPERAAGFKNYELK